MARPWMPLYVADYLADTGHLSAAEHGAYLLLIMHYWANGGLPCDDKKLARIARMSDKEWKAAKDTVAGFFSEDWKHDRIERELADANAAYERRASAGRKGGNAKSDSKQSGSNATSLPDALLKQSQPQPHILAEPDGSAAASGPPPPGLQQLCEEAAGTSYGRGFGIIRELVESGVPVDERVLPVIRDLSAFLRKRGKSVDSWAFFAKAISDPTVPSSPPDAPVPAVIFIEKDADGWDEAQSLVPKKVIVTKRGPGAFFPRDAVPPALRDSLAKRGAA